jgi:hypothetical protein
MSVTSGEMAAIRAEVGRLTLPDQCTITRVSPGTDNADGSGEPGSSATTTYACRVSPLGGSPVEQVFAARLQNVSGFTITLPFDADVNERDVIVSGAQTYQVLGVLDPVSFQTAVRVAAKRIN